jgi:type II secretory pathway predicted ATPase ExeA
METRWYAPRENAQTENLFAEQSPTLLRNIHNRVFPRGDQITLQGDLWAGKSAVAKLLSENLSIERLSGGTFMRKLATERWITLEQMNVLAQSDHKYDIAADMKQVELWRGDAWFIIDGRVWPLTVPHSRYY